MRASATRLHRVLGVLGATAALAGILAAGAQAHAIVSPPVAKSGRLQQFTLSVPTEKDKVVTNKVEIDLPTGFSPGWKRTVASTGTGDKAVVQKVTWSGGKVPTEEDSVFRFNASVDKAKTYKFHVIQTYSDGSIADWSGPESSDTPAPTIEALSSFGGGGGSKTLAWR